MTATNLTGPRRPTLRRAVAGTAVLLALASGLSACGGSGSSATAPTAGSTASGGPGAGRDRGQFEAVRACLKAAGIAVPTPSARPTGEPSGEPGGAPSGDPTARPREGGGGGIDVTDPKVQAALKACGLTVPTRRPTAQPSG